MWNDTHLFAAAFFGLVLIIIGISFFLYRSSREFWIAEKCIKVQSETIETKNLLIEEQAALIKVLRSQTEYLQGSISKLGDEVLKDFNESVSGLLQSDETVVSVDELHQAITVWREKVKHHWHSPV